MKLYIIRPIWPNRSDGTAKLLLDDPCGIFCLNRFQSFEKIFNQNDRQQNFNRLKFEQIFEKKRKWDKTMSSSSGGQIATARAVLTCRSEKCHIVSLPVICWTICWSFLAVVDRVRHTGREAKAFCYVRLKHINRCVGAALRQPFFGIWNIQDSSSFNCNTPEWFSFRND